MPLYNYVCTECNHVVEEYRAIDQRNYKTDCPKCGGLSRRMLSTKTTFILKGGGWYKDGYK